MRHTKISSEPQSQPLRSVCQAEVSTPQSLGTKDEGPDAESKRLFTPSTRGAPDRARRMSEYKGYPAKWAQAQTLESGKPEFLSWLCHISQVAPGESHNLCELVSYEKVGIMLAPTQQGCSEDEMR